MTQPALAFKSGALEQQESVLDAMDCHITSEILRTDIRVVRRLAFIL